MDVDSVDQSISDEAFLQLPISSRNRSDDCLNVTIDDMHPFDLDSYISAYKGRTAAKRLLFILRHCPTLSAAAFTLVQKQVMSGRDTSLLQKAVNSYSARGKTTSLSPNFTQWIAQTAKRNDNEKNKLEVELKTYTSNMIKESIRMAHRDLGDFYGSIGDNNTSLKHYSQSREYCSTSQHVLDMCISVLELLVDQENYAHIATYVFKAESTLEATSDPKSGSKNLTPAQLIVQTKIDFASGLSQLGQGSFEKAAQVFLRIGPPKQLGDWDGKITAPGDIAIYGTLCALATFPRNQIKSQLLENETFGVYLEQEPQMREIVESFLSSKYKVVLELLDRYSTRHLLDIHLSPFVNELYSLIRARAIVLYFKPYTSIHLSRMAAAFGMSTEQMEKVLIGLIQSGDIKGRIDSHNKILKAKQIDHRTALFSRAIQTGADMQAANRKLLLHLRLQQANLIVKQPSDGLARAGGRGQGPHTPGGAIFEP